MRSAPGLDSEERRGIAHAHPARRRAALTVPRRGPGRAVAVVIGTGCMEVVRALALAGVRSAVVEPRRDEAKYSRYAAKLFDWDWEHPVEDSAGRLVERLLEFGRRQSDPPVLFPCSDQALLFASRFRGELEPTYRSAVAAADLVEDLSDKQRFSALSERLSLPVPATRIVEGASAFAEADLEPAAFPLIVKPALRGPVWSATEPAKAVRVDDPAALQELAGRFRGHEQRFVVQRCVPGPETAIESYHVYVDSRGSIRAEFTGRKIRTLPLEFGHSTALALTEAPDVTRLGRDLIPVLGLRGVAKFDFKRSPQGELYLLEVNARFSLWHHLGARAGVNIPAMVYADLTGTRWDDRPTDRRTSATWVHPKDVLSARRAGVPALIWLAWAAHADAKAFWAWNDPLPLVAATGAWIGENLPTATHRRPTA